MMKQLWAIVLGSLLCSCAGSSDFGERISGDNFDGIIANAEKYPYGLWPGEQSFTVSEADVVRCESKIEAYLSERAIIDPSLQYMAQNLSEYKRQYYGATRTNRSFLVTSYYHKSTDVVTKRMWLRAPVVVMGGGWKYFETRYDLDEKRYTRVDVNAPE